MNASRKRARHALYNSIQSLGYMLNVKRVVSDIAIFVLKRDVKLQLTKR